MIRAVYRDNRRYAVKPKVLRRTISADALRARFLDDPLAAGTRNVLLVSTLAAALLAVLGMALAVGDAPHQTLKPLGKVPRVALEEGEVLAWSNGKAEPLRLVPGKAQHRRHRRKYAAGDLADDAFVFRGPENKLKLRAQNLAIFLQMAEGVDDDTWLHHLGQRDYSKWFRSVIKDDGLAEEAEQIERGGGRESRKRIQEAIEKRYTLPE